MMKWGKDPKQVGINGLKAGGKRETLYKETGGSSYPSLNGLCQLQNVLPLVLVVYAKLVIEDEIQIRET
jgi:hypothetical protein